MIAQALAFAVTVSSGILLVVSGLRRRSVSPAHSDDTEPVSGMRAAIRQAVGRIGHDLQHRQRLGQDAAAIDRSLESHALAKLGGLVTGVVVLAGSAVLFAMSFGVDVPLPLVLALGAGGALFGWWLPDSLLKTEADKERERFKQSSEAWLELVAQLVTAGSDTHAALHTAAGYSNQPAFAAIRDALVEASAVGEPPWIGLRRLADARRLRFLDPFVNALELAGTTGAGARQAILSQVDAARSKSLSEADAAAASASEKTGAPLALIGGAFMMLMGYPPLASIMDSGATPTGF